MHKIYNNVIQITDRILVAQFDTGGEREIVFQATDELDEIISRKEKVDGRRQKSSVDIMVKGSGDTVHRINETSDKLTKRFTDLVYI